MLLSETIPSTIDKNTTDKRHEKGFLRLTSIFVKHMRFCCCSCVLSPHRVAHSAVQHLVIIAGKEQIRRQLFCSIGTVCQLVKVLPFAFYLSVCIGTSHFPMSVPLRKSARGSLPFSLNTTTSL